MGVKVAWLVGLSDMRCDKGFDKMDLGFCLILLGFEGFLNMTYFFNLFLLEYFLSWCRDEPAIPGSTVHKGSIRFCHPHSRHAQNHEK